MPRYKVTILLAAYNRLEMLKESVASAVGQDLPCIEVLIVDDGSDDATRQWLDDTASGDPRVRVIHQAHSGIAAARQRGVENSEGEFVCILDSDDILFPHALTRIMAAFDRRPDVGLAYCNILIRMPDETVIGRAYPRFSTNAEMIRATLTRPVVPFKHSGTTFRRDKALTLGGYDRGLAAKVDVDLFLKFLANGVPLLLIEEPLLEYRMHADSVSAHRLRGLSAWWRLIDRYGPQNWLLRAVYKVYRTASEMCKAIYLILALLRRRRRRSKARSRRFE